MSSIVLCNTGSDSLSKINSQDLKIENLYLSIGEKPFGPHGLSLYKDKILVANNYNNSISIIDLNEFKEEKNLYIGAHPNDLVAHNNRIYVTCGESNSVIVYDLINERTDFELPTGGFPHSIELLKKEKLAFISNMAEDSISVIDCNTNKIIKNIIVGENPIKINLSDKNNYLYVCMSYLGSDKEGYVGIISLKNLDVIAKIKVGLAPVDLFEYNNYLYVSNFCGGSISVINLNTFKEEKKINIGGMPRGIVKINEKIYIGDYLNGSLKIVDVKNKFMKSILTGIEPNEMLIINEYE